MSHTDEELAELINELGNLVEWHEVDASQGQSAEWIDGYLHIASVREPGQLFAFCSGADVERMFDNFIDTGLHLGAETMEVFYFGKHSFEGDQFKRKVKRILGESGPGVLIRLIDANTAWQCYPVLLYDEGLLADVVRGNTARELEDALSQLPTGEADPHEELVRRIVDFAFSSCLSFKRKQVTSLDKTARRDLLYKIRPDSMLERHVAGATMASNNLLVEAKNCKKNEGEHVRQLGRYLSRASVASVGILVTRQALSNELRKVVVDERRDNGGRTIILPLCDADLKLMLRNARAAQFHLNEQFLIETFEQVLMDTH